MYNSVYILSAKCGGAYLYSDKQSGYDMYYIRTENGDMYYYPSDVIFNKPIPTSQLWQLLETRNIPVGMQFKNNRGVVVQYNGSTLVTVDNTLEDVFTKTDSWVLIIQQ